jgi:glycosyltransferase involved in cell wall biosynthesis
LRIAVDARELAGRPTGVGRYLIELLRRWESEPEARRHHWQLYAHTPVTVPNAFAGGVAVLPGSGGTRWEQWTLPRALAARKPDVLFAPGYTAPLTAPCPVALTVHDVSFAAHPEWFSPREGMRRRSLTTWSARRARVVITDSQFSRDEIVRRLGIPEEKLRVIPLGTPDLTPKPSTSREPMVLYVGSIFRRRLLPELIAAFVTHVAPAVAGSRLEIVGENRMYPAGDPTTALAAVPSDIAERVRVRSYVDNDTLRDLYGRASVFAFLSTYEGFGLTPLEALRAGVPPIVLDTPVAREIYGPAARYVSDVSTTTALGLALCELLTDPAARDDILRHATVLLARYDWTRTAHQTLAAIEEAAGV